MLAKVGCPPLKFFAKFCSEIKARGQRIFLGSFPKSAKVAQVVLFACHSKNPRLKRW